MAKRPTDPNQLGKWMVEQATGQVQSAEDMRSAAAKMLGSLGGKKGGPARAKALSKSRRSEIAKAAARARWKAKGKKGGK